MPKDAKPATVSVIFQTDVIVDVDTKSALPPGHYVAGSICTLSPAAADEALVHRWATLAPELP